MNDITPEYIREQISKGKKYTLVFKKVGPSAIKLRRKPTKYSKHT